MIDDPYLRAVIAGNRDAERAAIEEKKNFFEWTEDDMKKALDPNNAEVRRLLDGPAEDPEVARLAKVLKDIEEKN